MVGELARADDDAWRISLADIDTDGPLAVLAGQHRLLTVVDGPVLGLVVGAGVGGAAQVLEPQRPYVLTTTAVASVPEGPVRLLDVAVDPQVVTPYVTVLELGRTSVLPLAADQRAYVLKGEAAGTLLTGLGEVTGRCTVAVITLERG